MKKIFILISAVILYFTTSCISVKKQTAEKSSEGDFIVNVKGSYDLKFTVITIDSCEYLLGGAKPAAVTIMTHKGNCKYCLARQKK
ncbi:MAG TPA: hypothetical protein VNZ49_07240 [Bacteroidia bacterium]|jgi:hypothetical protein|nr:hypothetical protein [Bacteroidia bacterium]